ncbi:MAG: hypothetical protein CSA54_01905 [Gammaproteobacteria bacterium]|nr:MAG: hypothetical protein CSA54_01905 [Gammaproteobacteria bacterium]
MNQLDAVLQHVDDNLPAMLERLFELMRIESISTDSAYAGECVKAADWLAADLVSLGFEASRRDTTGHPMVVGHHEADTGGPHVLFYGHYDVQPVDPLELWHRAPFDPALEDTDNGKVIRGRGAADDKGQLMTFIEACRAWKAVTGKLPTKVSVFLEGEEESGSPSLVPFLEANKKELSVDLALICDTGMWDSETPLINTTLRGSAGGELTLTGPAIDLHSGMYGGPAINPIRVLVKILADLHDDNGCITLPGFYDGVPILSEEQRAEWASLNHDGKGFLDAVGLSTPAGEPGFTVLEQIWARPTCEVNGIGGGYQGEGFKTVLPSQAMAKISFRLVGDQDPDAVIAAFEQHIEERLPPDVSYEFKGKSAARATQIDTSDPAFQKARDALSDEWPRKAIFGGSGGSIPVTGHIKSILDMDSLMVGFGLDDDAIHSPNEKYSLQSFHKGTRSWVRILAALAET